MKRIPDQYQEFQTIMGPVLIPIGATRSEVSAIVRNQLEERRRNKAKKAAMRCSGEECSCRRGRPPEYNETAADPISEWLVPLAVTGTLGAMTFIAVFRLLRRVWSH